MIDLQSLINEDRKKVNNSLFISIDGHGGSGKSTLARGISRIVNGGIIEIDDFASMENPTNWYSNVLQKVFLPIKSGAVSLSYERSSWWPKHHPDPVKNQSVRDIMIIEGVGATRKEFRPFLGLSIFIDTPKELCLQRGIARDLKSNAGSEAQITSHWEQWIQEELEYFEAHDPKSVSEITIDGTTPIEEQMMGVTPQVS